jgi:hypothetical protein
MISPKDDQLHSRTSDPSWNESAWFGYEVPERELTGWVYFYHRPNLNYTVGGVALFDPSGGQTYNCLYYDWGDMYPMAPNAGMFNFALPNGLRVAQHEPLQSFDFSYRDPAGQPGQGCELNLRWEATKEPHATGNPEGTHEWGLAKGHFEQPGRMTGTVEVAGDRFEVSAISMRDRSWGPRSNRMANRGHFSWGVADDNNGFVVFSGCATPDRDPVFGITDSINAGWYLKDGEYGSLESGQITTERNEDGRPLRVEITALDHLGRSLHAVGRPRNTLAWHGYPFMFQWWALFEWDVDGRTVYGEEQDYHPLQHHRHAVRQHRAVSSTGVRVAN